MRTKLISWLSVLLTVGGLLLPAASALALPATDYWAVTSSGPVYSGGSTIWTYTVTKVGNPANGLSHVEIGLCAGLGGISSSPAFGARGPGSWLGSDDVLKWDAGDLSGNGSVITVTYQGVWPTGTQSWWAAEELSEDPATGVMNGPVCADPQPDFTVSTSVSQTNNPATGQSSTTLTGGGTAYYFYTFANTGNMPLVIDSAVDDKLGSISFPAGIVAPGAAVTATASKSFAALAYGAADQVETNTFTVNALFMDEPVAPKTAQATVVNRAETPPPPPQVTDFTVTKLASTSADPATGQISVALTGGGTVHYFYKVTNTGDTVITITQALDDKLGSLNFTPATLFPGQSATAAAAKTFPALPPGTAAQNEVNVVQVWAGAAGPRLAQATVVNNPIPSRPDFTVQKRVSASNDPATGQSTVSLVDGGTVYYFYTVTNTGNVPLTITRAIDNRLGSVSLSPAELAPGASATGMLTKTFRAGRLETTETNTVSVTASAGGTAVGPKTAIATVINTPSPKGGVEVLVLDGSPRNPVPVPVKNASVKLGALGGDTDQNGRIAFPDLAFGSYWATAEAYDPQHPANSELKSGGGTATISRDKPNGLITVVLSWVYPDPTATLSVSVCDAFAGTGGSILFMGPRGEGDRLVQPGPDGRFHMSGLTAGVWTVVLQHPGLPAPVTRTIAITTNGSLPDNAFQLDLSGVCPAAPGPATGRITGRICSPPDPGAEISARGPGGRSASTLVPSVGRLGKRLDYGLNDLEAGSWVLTLKVPGKEAAQQTVAVEAGKTTAAEDFSTACTGSGATPMGYLGGALLLLSGLGLQWAIRRRLV